MNPAFFLMLRFVFAFLFGGLLFLIFARTGGKLDPGIRNIGHIYADRFCIPQPVG